MPFLLSAGASSSDELDDDESESESESELDDESELDELDESEDELSEEDESSARHKVALLTVHVRSSCNVQVHRHMQSCIYMYTQQSPMGTSQS